MQSTLEKFGYPASLIKELDHWMVLLRPQQVTLGSLILIEKSGQTRFSDLSSESFIEYGQIVKKLERALESLFRYDKINYLMLMMVDPEVHFHVIPRYGGEQEFGAVSFIDAGWPGLPELSSYTELTTEIREKMIKALRTTLD
ncbi:MAG: HIT family protein [Bacteroidota bacterium]